MRRASLALLAAFLVFLVSAGSFAIVPSRAFARASSDYRYDMRRVWNASMRLVRVDLGCPLADRDEQAGYFLFEYRDGSRSFPGSVELAETEIDGVSGVRVVVKIPALPSYVERMILDRLTRKLTEEYGDPPPVRRRPDPAPAAPEENTRPTERDGEGTDPAESSPGNRDRDSESGSSEPRNR